MVDAKITFVICDDDRSVLKGNERFIRAYMDEKSVPFSIHAFDDGDGAEKFIRKRGNTKGIILVTDGQMARVSGHTLLKNLNDASLLPSHSAVCTANTREDLNAKLLTIGLSPSVATYIDKADVGAGLPAFIDHALPNVAAEVGLTYTAPARPANASAGVDPKSTPGGVK